MNLSARVKKCYCRPQWNQYMKCNRLPDPNSIREINTFIFVWAELEANESMSYTVQKAKEAMEVN